MNYEDGICSGYYDTEPYYCDLAGCLCYGGDCRTCQQQMLEDLSQYEPDDDDPVYLA